MRLYGSTIPGVQATIVFLAPEGREVATGDEIIRFDTAPFELALGRDAALLAQAEAELARVQEDERLESLSATAERDAAATKIASAESSLRNETEGRGRLALEEAVFADADAARQLTRTRQQFDDVQALLDKGFATRAEVDRAALDLGRAEDQRRLAAQKLASLREFERPAALDRGRADVDAARQDLQRARDASAARLAQRRAVLALAARRVDEYRAKVATATDHLARTVIRAEAPGLVVYRDLFFGSDRRKPQVGDEVWSNQPVVAVPNTRDLLVDTRVREIDLHRVSGSRRVVVSVDAYPSLRLTGTVTLVGTIAQEDLQGSGMKSFPVTVQLHEHDARLRPGMTARVEMIVADIAAALVVPTAAIVDGERPHCLVLESGRVRQVPVRIVADNGVEAVVEGDLRAGARVLFPSTPGGTAP
jgi:HlyD family secretion protein